MEIVAVERLLPVFGTLIVIPLVAAFLTEREVARRASRAKFVTVLSWAPVPLLGVVVFLVATSQVHVVAGSIRLLGPVAAVFGLYLMGAAVIGFLLARSLGLPARSARTVVFSLGTRNSFVVLPFALALPEA